MDDWELRSRLENIENKVDAIRDLIVELSSQPAEAEEQEEAKQESKIEIAKEVESGTDARKFRVKPKAN